MAKRDELASPACRAPYCYMVAAGAEAISLKKTLQRKATLRRFRLARLAVQTGSPADCRLAHTDLLY